MKAHPDQWFGNISHAQHGEDLLVINLFTLLGINKPSYLDIGAHHPLVLSNTALMYERGCRGVNVEANPFLIDEFRTQRPADINVNVGVALETGVKTFHMYDSKSGRNTFCEKEVEKQSGLMRVKSSLELPVFTLGEIVASYCGGLYPDFLNMDIEGLDFDVLDDADFSGSHPKVISVETRRDETERMRMMMCEKKYNLHSRMGENLIFVHTNYFWRCF